jgi:hypothetical protein
MMIMMMIMMMMMMMMIIIIIINNKTNESRVLKRNDFDSLSRNERPKSNIEINSTL